MSGEGVLNFVATIFLVSGFTFIPNFAPIEKLGTFLMPLIKEFLPVREG
jgi:hypothetical protein